MHLLLIGLIYELGIYSKGPFLTHFNARTYSPVLYLAPFDGIHTK